VNEDVRDEAARGAALLAGHSSERRRPRPRARRRARSRRAPEGVGRRASLAGEQQRHDTDERRRPGDVARRARARSPAAAPRAGRQPLGDAWNLGAARPSVTASPRDPLSSRP
jgi:hypothetical protein